MIEEEPGRPGGALSGTPAEGRKSHKFKREVFSGRENLKPSPILRGREKVVASRAA
jgi:hypothetical protein